MDAAAAIAVGSTLFNLAVTVILRRAYVTVPSTWLRERGIASTFTTIVAGLVALVLVNRALGRPLPVPVSEVAILLVALLSSAAAAWWLITWRWSRT